jgi:hypothetical protein
MNYAREDATRKSGAYAECKHKPLSVVALLQVGSTHKISNSEIELQELQEVIRLVREGPPSPCPLLLYTVMNSDNK